MWIQPDESVLAGWTIYRHPDFPQHFAVLAWWVGDDGELVTRGVATLCADLDEARAQIPSGAIRFARETTDDPSVIETWL